MGPRKPTWYFCTLPPKPQASRSRKPASEGREISPAPLRPWNSPHSLSVLTRLSKPNTHKPQKHSLKSNPRNRSTHHIPGYAGLSAQRSGPVSMYFSPSVHLFPLGPMVQIRCPTPNVQSVQRPRSRITLFSPSVHLPTQFNPPTQLLLRGPTKIQKHPPQSNHGPTPA